MNSRIQEITERIKVKKIKKRVFGSDDIEQSKFCNKGWLGLR